MRRLVVILVLLAGPALAAATVTEDAVRALVARQEQAWNAGRLGAYFAAFTPDARFTDQAYVGDKPPVPYGTSTLEQARAQARKTQGRSREAGRVTRVEVAPDGRSARVVSSVGSIVQAGERTRRLCASREQTVVLSGGALKIRAQVDTYVKCRGG